MTPGNRALTGSKRLQPTSDGHERKRAGYPIEYSALQALVEGEQRTTERGTVVWLAGLNPGVLEVARKAGLDTRLGRERLLFNARAVIERYQALEAQSAEADGRVVGVA